MKKAVIGGILLIIGLSILSPFEELLILAPLSMMWDMPELIIAFNALAILCLAGAIFLLGTSSVTGPIHKHYKMAIVGLIILAVFAYWYVI